MHFASGPVGLAPLVQARLQVGTAAVRWTALLEAGSRRLRGNNAEPQLDASPDALQGASELVPARGELLEKRRFVPELGPEAQRKHRSARHGAFHDSLMRQQRTTRRSRSQ